MRVILDQDKCVASGQCVTAAGMVFDQRDEDGIAVLLAAEPGPERDAEVRLAAALCPAVAIRIET